MRTTFASLLILLLLYSCSSETKNTDQVLNGNQDTTALVSPVNAGTTEVKKDSTKPHSIYFSEQLSMKGIKYNGEIEEIWEWYDKNGQNILLLSAKSKVVAGEGEDNNSTELYARHYAIKDKTELLWEFYDAEKECFFDLTAKFMGSPDITDLDNNGIKESFLVYKLACRSDVSPATMKIIVHEGRSKYALRGNDIMKVIGVPDSLIDTSRELNLSKIPKSSANENYMISWGCYENTNDFKNASPVFLEHAIELWKANCIDNPTGE